jgi:hypothetical protein
MNVKTVVSFMDMTKFALNSLGNEGVKEVQGAARCLGGESAATEDNVEEFKEKLLYILSTEIIEPTEKMNRVSSANEKPAVEQVVWTKGLTLKPHKFIKQQVGRKSNKVENLAGKVEVDKDEP